MKYFNTRDLAKILGYNDDAYIRRLIAEGKLKAEKKGKEWLVSEEDASNYRVKSIIGSKFKTFFSFNHELRLLVDEFTKDEYRILGPKEGLATFTLTKAYKTHGAILLLCKEGYGEDSSVLVRTLFELMVNLMYVLKDPTDERAYRYYAYDWVLRDKMINAIEHTPEMMSLIEQREMHPKPGDETSKKIHDMAKQANDKYKYKGTSWSDKSIKEMAEEVGRGKQYGTIYRLHSQHVHSASRTINSYVSMTLTGLEYSMGISENEVEVSLVSAFDFFGTTFDQVGDHMGWGTEPKLKELVDRYVKAVHSLNSEITEAKK